MVVASDAQGVTDERAIDEQLRKAEGADDHSAKSDAKVVFRGLSEHALIPLLYAAIGVGFLGLVAALLVGLVVMTQLGTISATATNAVNIATMAERNAKLSAYTAELAARKAGVQFPLNDQKE
jgi:hypothetical protein